MKRKYIPTWYSETIFKIDFEKILNSGIKYIICDLDNTILPYHVPLPSEKEKQLFEKLKSMGLKVYIVSNNITKRVKFFAENLKVDYLANAYKPLIWRIRKHITSKNYNNDEWLFIGDQILTDIWAANKLKIRSILVEPLIEKESLRSFFNRKLDIKIRRKLLMNKDELSIEREDDDGRNN